MRIVTVHISRIGNKLGMRCDGMPTAFTCAPNANRATMALCLCLERVRGIEPLYEAWEAAVLPLNYTRSGAQFTPPVCHLTAI